MLVKAESGASFWTFILPQNKDLFPCYWWGLWMKSPVNRWVSALVLKDVLCAWGWATIWSSSGRKATPGLKTRKLQWGWRGCEWQSWCWCSCIVVSWDVSIFGIYPQATSVHLCVGDIPSSLGCDVLQTEGRKDMKCSASKNHPEWDSSDFEKEVWLLLNV